MTPASLSTPQFLQTYYILGVTGTALEANFQQNYAGPLQRFIARMLWAYNTSVQGIASPFFSSALPDYLTNVYTRICLSTQKQWKAVYVGIGLADLRAVVNKLQSQLVIPAIGAFDENLYWSMRSMTDTLVRSGFPSPQTASGLSLFSTIQELQQAGRVDPSADFFVSWRQALDACAV